MTRSLLVVFLVSVLVSPIWADGLSLPVVVETGRITVRAEGGLDKLAGEVADTAPRALKRIAADLPELPIPAHIDLRIVRSSANIAGAAPPGYGAPQWAIGVAYPAENVIVVSRHRKGQYHDFHSTVAHELAHLALGAALKGRAPRWLNEGFAYLHSSDWSMERTRTLTGMAWTGDVIPLEELDRSFPNQEQEAHRAYAQSYDFVAFLARRGRFVDKEDDGDPWPFRDFLAAIARGKTVDEAARAHYGTPISRLFTEWVVQMRERYMLSPIGLFGLGVWALGGVLLVFAYMRKRRLAKRKIAEWDEEDARRLAAT